MKLIRDMDINELVDWATGTLIIGIGEGQFRNTVSRVILAIMSETKQPPTKKPTRKRKAVSA